MKRKRGEQNDKMNFSTLVNSISILIRAHWRLTVTRTNTTEKIKW